MKQILITAFILSLFLPSAVFAQIDQRCFTESECIAVAKDRKSFVPADTRSEIMNACNGVKNTQGTERLGFCLPAGKTRTTIAFGGRQEFENIGDFIGFAYRFGIGIAGLIAVVIIITSGLQWTISGGSAETIGAAQKRIGGALVGLALLALSYSILGRMNPNLVNLRLPQIWLINTQGTAPTYCKNLAAGVQLGWFGKSGIGATRTQKKEASQNTEFAIAFSNDEVTKKITDPKKAVLCGNDYFVDKTGGQTCHGSICPAHMICTPKEKAQQLAEFECARGDAGGTVYHGLDFGLAIPFHEGWEYPWINNNETEFHGLCNNGKTFEIPSNDITDNNEEKETQKFIITFSGNQSLESIITRECDKKDELRGFYFLAEMNENIDGTDENHMIGKNGKDLGDSGAFEIIKTKFDPHYLFTLEEAEEGIFINIDAGEIHDIDVGNAAKGGNLHEARKKAYGILGYQ